MRIAAKERGAIRDIQRGTRAQALDEVGVGDVEPAEGDEVCEIQPTGLLCQTQIIAVVGDVTAIELSPQKWEVKSRHGVPRSLRYPFDYVQIGKFEDIEPLDDAAVRPGRIAVGY